MIKIPEEIVLYRDSQLFQSEVDIVKEIEAEVGLKATSRPDAFDMFIPLQFIAEDYRVKHITMHEYPFKSFPEALTKLKSIETINFSSTELESLPESIGRLSNLTTLAVDRGKLSNLPNSLKNLKSTT